MVPIKYGLRLNSDSRYSDFKKELSQLCQLDANVMLVCELSNSQIRCVLQDEHKIKVSTATELVVYEMPRGQSVMRPRTSTELSGNAGGGSITIENGLKDIQRSPGDFMFSLSDHLYM